MQNRTAIPTRSTFVEMAIHEPQTSRRCMCWRVWLLLLVVGLLPTSGQGQEANRSGVKGPMQYDVVVVGGTPGGIAAAIAAAREGRSVALVEYHPTLGGMSASGLGKSDVETREAIGGMFREFVHRVHKYYRDKYGDDSKQVTQCRDGYYYEPSVAASIFAGMVEEQPKITVYRKHRLEEAIRAGRRVIGVRVKNRTSAELFELRGQVFIDATYEGDLAAAAGARYRLGREGRSEFNELNAGVVYQNYETRSFLAGTTGEGDRLLQAYTFRLCLTTDPKNSARLEKPPTDYDRNRYVGYLDDWKSGRFGPPREFKDGMGYFPSTFGTTVRALSIAEIPNQKTDVNMNPRPLGFPFAGENYDYPEADWETRERITARIRNITLGMLYFLQNDSEVPADHRALANKFHLSKDEFTDNGNFPWQLYVREARRIMGLYTLSEQDVILDRRLGRTRVHADSIAAGEFPIDSFPVRKREPGQNVALEGYLLMQDALTKPYQIPYRIIVPEEVDGLLVPVAASTTHVAFSTIRMEPTWMALGHAAGLAANLAITSEVQPRAVDVERLQRRLLAQGQIITYFKDINRETASHAALQFFGTRGFFDSYLAEADQPIERGVARQWLEKVGVKGEDATVWRGMATAALTRKDLQQLLPHASLTAKVKASASDVVTRGELCQVLFELGQSR